MIDSINIPVQQISLLAVVISALGLWLSSSLSKLSNDKWNKNSRDLSQIIDIDNKLNHGDKKVRELVELHQAIFHIEKEKLREYKKRQYFMKAGWSLSFKNLPVVLGFTLIRVLFIALCTSLFIAVYFIFLQNNLMNFAFFWLLIVLLFVLTARAGMPLQRILSRQTADLTGYNVCLEKKGSTDRKFEVRIPKDNFAKVYDYIGIPVWNNIEMYRKVTFSDQRVLYIYDYTREMTLLEFEWVNQLNQINKWFRKTSPYIPFLKVQPSQGITYSAYYLLEK